MFNNIGNNHSLIIIPAIALAIIYVSSHYIDHWWIKNYTPNLEAEMKSWFKKYSPYYNFLSDTERKKFEKRIVIYVESREFKSVGSELGDVPYDIKCIIASQGIKMCMGLDDILIKDLDRIYLYKHPFPSPKYQFLHTAEVDTEDGVIILSTEQALPGIVNPLENYNIALHTYADAFIQLFTNVTFPKVEDLRWQKLELINGISETRIKKTLGMEDLNLLAVHIVAFFDFRDQYEKIFEVEALQLKNIFNC
jgi:hypothetical protein